MELFSAQWTEGGGWSAPLPQIDGERTLVTVFAGADSARCAGGLADVRAAYPSSTIVGCSTAGEILNDAVWDDTVTVAVARFEDATLHCASMPVGDGTDSHAAGVEVARRLREADPELQAIFVLSDGLAVNGSSLVAGLVEGSGGQTVVTGGLAGDGDRFTATWVLVDGEPRAGWITAVGLSGDT